MDLNTERIIHRGRSHFHSSALLPCKLTLVRGHWAKINSVSQWDSQQNTYCLHNIKKEAYADSSKKKKHLKEKTIHLRLIIIVKISFHVSLTVRNSTRNKLFRRWQGKAKQRHACRYWTFNSLLHRIWLNTVHHVVQIQIKGSCCYALDIPKELSAKIVQVLFHFHTEETETKERCCKQWIHKITIYSQCTKHTAEEW